MCIWHHRRCTKISSVRKFANARVRNFYAYENFCDYSTHCSRLKWKSIKKKENKTKRGRDKVRKWKIWCTPAEVTNFCNLLPFCRMMSHVANWGICKLLWLLVTVHHKQQCPCPGGWNFSFNPLWGHCQEYKSEKNAILQECLLSDKRSTFAHYNLTLSESFCLTDHEKQIQKFVAHWKVCQKSSQREVIRKNAYIAPKPQSVLLPAFHLKFSRSPTKFQASQARDSPLRSKNTRPSHAVV